MNYNWNQQYIFIIIDLFWLIRAFCQYNYCDVVSKWKKINGTTCMYNIWLIKSGKKRKVWNLNETIYTIYFSKSILSDDCVFNSDIK